MSKNISKPTDHYLPSPATQATKKDLKEIAQRFLLAPSLTNPEKLAFLKRMEDLVSIIKLQLVPEVLEGMEGNTLEVDGITFTSQVRNTYDFSHDPEIQRLEEALKKRKALMKKAATPGMVLVDDETGEEIPPARIKTGKPFLKAEY